MPLGALETGRADGEHAHGERSMFSRSTSLPPAAAMRPNTGAVTGQMATKQQLGVTE
ncbi:MAG: hypothetical protein IIC70_02055 [Acidobacteria bacterium]|nr:hypothetical protein [Acidobacteriota bacterium]